MLTMTLIFTMSFSSVAYAADTDTAGETEGTNTEATTMDTSEEQTSDPAEDTANTQQAAEAEETQNPEALGEEAGTAPAIDENDVAAIGEQGYDTLAAAAKAAPEGATIKLLKDIDMAGGLNITKSVTLDLAGKKVLFKGENYIYVNGAVLTIKDSEDNKGTIYTEDYGIYAQNGGSVTVNGGTIDSAYAALGANNTTGDANFTINGGILTSRLSEAIYMPSQQDIVINGGTLNGGISARMGQITITGGTINGMRADQTADSMDEYWNYSGSAWIGDAIYVWGGTYNSANKNGNSCNINISGGTINGNAHNAIAVYDIANNYDQNVKVNISGTANINGNVAVDDTHKVSNPKNVKIGISVTGGTFSTDPSKFVAAGYIATKQSNGTWTVAETHKVAEVNGTKYDALAAAVASANEGATITLLDNIDIDSQITISKDLTINLNGKSIAAKDARALHIAGGEVNITGEGTISANKVKSFDSAYSVIRVGDNNGDARNAKLTVGEKVTVSSNHCYGITVFGNKTTETVVVNGKVNVTGEAAAISGNGSTGYGNTSITVNGEVSAKNDNAIYHPQNGTLIINGKVTGTGGIEAKAGNTEISVGSKAVITATAEGTSHNPNNNGCSTSGYAIAAVQNDAYEGNAVITVEGGTINGPVDIVKDNDAKTSASIVIKGGTFSVEPKADFISEGYEAKKTGDSWTVDTIKVAKSGENEYASLEDAVADVPENGTETTIKLLKNVENIATLTIKNGQNVTLDLNGKNISSAIRSDNNSKHHYAIDNYGTLTINDSSEAGTGTIKARGIENLENGYMTINGGKLIACDSNGGASIWNEGDLTVNGGTFVTTHAGTASDQYGAGCLNNSGKTCIKGGVFKSVNKRTYAIISTGEIEITPAEGKTVEVTGAHGGLGVDSGTAVINGGTYASSEYYGLYVSNDGEGRDPELATVTVNGGFFDGANYSVWIGSDYNNPVNSTIKINGGEFKKPLNAQDCTRDGAIVVTGGYFSDSSADNYLADGKTLVESDKSEFTYMVADKKAAAEADVDIKAAVGNVVVDGESPAEVQAAIAGTTVSKKALDAAVKREINKDIAVDTEDVNKAITSGVNDGVFADDTKASDVTVFAQAYLDIAVADYDGDKCVLDITPMYQLVATTAGSAENINFDTNAVVIGEPQELKVNTAVEVKIPLPDRFTAKADNTVTIKHTKSDGTVYYYSAKVTAAGGKNVATFTNPNGFSTFEVLKLSDNTKLDKVELTFGDESIGTDIKANQLEYDIKFDAEKNVKDLTVNVAATANDRNAKIKVLVGGSEVKGKFVDLGLGTTTFNVLVLSEDDTAVLYTFNAIRCELVDDVTLNRDTFTYSGKAQAPAVTVKTADGTTLKNGDAYTVSYKGNRTSVGTHTVTVLCKGKYEGEISKNYTINPAKPAIKKIKSSKRKMKVYMTTKPGSNGAEYYKISYRQKGTSTWKSTTTSSSYKTIKGLKKGKRYYVKVYAYTGSYKSDDSTTKLSKKIR